MILVSTERIEIEGMEIKNMLLKPYNPEEAYDLIVRKLQKRKLKRWEKDKLIERLRSIPWQYASFIVREVPKIEDNNIDDYLKQNLKFDQVPHPIKNDNIKEYQALIVISQFEKLS